MRIALVVGLAALTVGLGFYAYRYSIRPVTLTVAAGSLDGEGARLMNALASRLASTANSRIRLKVIDTGTPLGAAEAFSKGEVDLAIVRGDATELKDARTVVVITHGVLMLIGFPGHVDHGSRSPERQDHRRGGRCGQSTDRVRARQRIRPHARKGKVR